MTAIGSDHAGVEFKEKIKTLLGSMGHDLRDLGTTGKESTDYPDWGHAVAEMVSSGKADRGVLICGTGIGMSIVANRHPGVRAAVCESATAARLARQHNDANILCIGERLTGWEQAADIVKVFFSTSFDGGERHVRRVGKMEIGEK